MVRVGRDRLGVKASPSFYFFRNGKQARAGAELFGLSLALRRRHVSACGKPSE